MLAANVQPATAQPADARLAGDQPSPPATRSDISIQKAEAESASPATLLEIANRLASPRYLVRSDAARLLKLADRQAVPAIMQAIEGGQLETLLQGLRILRHVATSHPPEHDGGAYDALQKLSNNIGVTAYQTRLAIAEVRSVRAAKAIDHLNDAGAYLGPGRVTMMSTPQTLRVLFLDQSFDAKPENLRWLKWLDGVQNVVLQDKALNAEIAKSLAGIRHLKRLFLSDGKIDRETLLSLATIPHLDVLEIHYVAIDPADVDALIAIDVSDSMMINGTGLANEMRQVIEASTAGMQFDFKRGGFLGVLCRNNAACIINEVVVGSGAEDAGLAPGDEIVRVNEAVVREFNDLKNEIAKFGVHEQVTVSFRRRQELFETEMTLKKHESYRIVIPGREFSR